MKDYTNNIEDAKKFILNFKENKDDIIVYLASKEEYQIPNTIENKNRLLDIMENQLKDYEDDNLLMEANSLKTTGDVAKIMFLILLALFIFVPALTNVFVATVITLIGCFNIIKDKQLCKILKIIDEKEKNRYFIDNKIEINEWLKNNNIRKNVSKKVDNVIKNELKKDNTNLDINNIDKLSINDLKRIKNIIELEKIGHFNQYQDKPKSLKKQRKNK